MRRHTVSKIPNLLDLTFTQAKKLARELCPQKTDTEIGEIVGMPHQTIQRIFSDPNYHPTMPNVPGLCKALENNIIIEWPVVQIGAYIIFEPAGNDDISIQQQIANLSKKFSEVLRVDAEAMKDGVRSRKECSEIVKQIDELIVVGETFKRQLLAKEAGK